MNHDYLTVVSIAGHNDGSLTIPAISKSIAELPGSRGLLISTARPAGLPDDIEWRGISPLDYRQYSLFVMFSLQYFISTDYCLIVQDDGWVLDGKNWSDDFLNYDYIGAPCHAAFVGKELVLAYQWVGEANPTVIQNGGLSLRSKKLLSGPTANGALYYFSDEKVFQNEDVQLTGIFRRQLEGMGIKFAPDSIAKNFSIEYLGPIYHDNVVFKKLFGLHGQTRKLISCDTISYQTPESQIMNIYRETELIEFLKNELNYKIIFKDE
jgi:hypothetical protein